MKGLFPPAMAKMGLCPAVNNLPSRWLLNVVIDPNAAARFKAKLQGALRGKTNFGEFQCVKIFGFW